MFAVDACAIHAVTFIKAYMNHSIKNFEELREHLWEEKQAIMEDLMERVDDLTEFERGRYQGEYRALDGVIGTLRNILKYGVEA